MLEEFKKEKLNTEIKIANMIYELGKKHDLYCDKITFILEQDMNNNNSIALVKLEYKV